MATQVQNRRGTTAEHSTFTGAVGEVTIDTDKDTVVVHDGSTAGGRPLLREDQSNLPTSAPTTGIYNNSGALALSTNGTGRLFVDANGNVGIGATSSITGLELSGDIQIKYAGLNSEPSGARYLIFNNTDTTLVNNQPLGGISWVNNDADATAGQAAFVKAYTATNTGSAYLTFGTGGQNNAQEHLRIDNSGRLLVGTSSATANGGVLQISNGITFPATQSDCSDLNTLDDYEEGTWTPVIVGSSSAGAANYGTRTGLYTKIGNTVTVFCQVTWSSGTGTGDLRVNGLPFTSNQNFVTVLGATGNLNYTLGQIPYGYTSSSNVINIGVSNANSGAVGKSYDPAGSMWVTLTYFV